MDITELRYVKELARCQNFSRAGENLFITQSALSQQIKKLEKELGFELFKRTSKQVALTENGQRFLKAADRTINEYEKLEREIQKMRSEISNKIIFGASTFISPIVSQILPEFLAKHGDVDFKLMELPNHELIGKVIDGEIDMAIFPLLPYFEHESKLQIFPVRQENVYAVMLANHPLASKKSVTLKDIVPYQLIFSSSRTGLKDVVMRAISEAGLSTNEPFDITSRAARMPFLKGGAISFSLSAMNEWKDTDNVVRLPIEPYICCDISIITPKGKVITPALSALMGQLTQALNA